MIVEGKTWLFVFSSESSYRLLRYVAQSAVSFGRKATFLYTGSHEGFYADVLAYSANQNIQAFSVEAELLSQPADLPQRPNTSASLIRSLLARSAIRFSRMPEQAAVFKAAYSKRVQVIYQLLQKLSAGLVICSEDGVSSDLAVFSAAKMAGLFTVDIPYGNGTQHELEVDLSRKSEEGRLIVANGLSLLMMRILAPQWLKKGAFKNALMFSPELIFAWESLGMTLRDAWIIHGGFSRLLCVENEMSRQQYLSEGIPKEKLRQTGSPYCDIMFDSLKNNDLSTLAAMQPKDIKSDILRILISWPPSYHETYPGKSEFNTYQEMTRTIILYLKSLPNVALTVSLHPACTPETRSFLSEIGISISDQYLLELIPLNDVFITYFSSTIRWALAAGKLVVNYDAYDIKITSFDSAPGFIGVTKFSDFRSRIDSILYSAEFFQERKKKQIENAAAWGILDGQCTKRIFSEIDKILQ